MVVSFLFLILGVWIGEAARQIGRLVIGLVVGLRPATVALGVGGYCCVDASRVRWWCCAPSPCLPGWGGSRRNSRPGCGHDCGF